MLNRDSRTPASAGCRLANKQSPNLIICSASHFNRMAWREKWGENDSAHHAARHATKTPFIFNLTPEIEIPDGYLVFPVSSNFLTMWLWLGQGAE
jgi:hypothetical protein